MVVFFHTLASLLLAWAAHRLGAPVEVGLTSGLLFLVNVAHFQAVYWISALDYPSALICSLGAILCYVRYDQRGMSLLLFGFHALLLLGVLAHPSAASTWFFCLYWSWRRGSSPKAIGRRLLPFAVLLVAAALLVFNMSHRTIATWRLLDIHTLEMAEVLFGMLRVMLWFLSRLVTTAHWIFLPVYRLQSWELAVSALVLAALVFLLCKRRDLPALWSMWTLLSLLPFLLLTESAIFDLPVGPSRYLYPATAGTALLLAWPLCQLRRRLGKLGDPVYVTLLLTLLFGSYFHLKKAEAVAFYTSGRSYLAMGDSALGTAQLRRAIERGPDIIDLEDAYVRLAMADIHNADTIDPTLQQARALFPDNVQFVIARLVRDSLSPIAGRRLQAERRLHELEGQGTGNPYWIAQFYKNLGDGFYDREDWEGAIQAYRQALNYHPARIECRVRLASVLLMTNRFTEAIAEYERALESEPNGEAHFNLALAYLLQGGIDDAQATYAAGLERYGRAAAEKLGVLRRLRHLVSLGIAADGARHIIGRHWPEGALP